MISPLETPNKTTKEMPFHRESFEQLLQNEYFLQWIIHPTEDSDKYWKQWIVENPERELEVKRIRELYGSLDLTLKPTLDATDKTELLDTILQHAGSRAKHPKTKPISWMSYAAASVIGFLLVFYGYSLISPTEVLPTDPINLPVTWLTKDTPKGTKSTFYLPDGSMVKLNSSSSLAFPTEFPQDERVVKLEGHAFFEVVSDSLRPFRVMTEDLKVEVLGTSFEVKAFTGETFIDVAVLEGRVSVQSRMGGEAKLSALEGARMNKGTGNLNQFAVDPLAYFAWKDGVLVFMDLPFRDAFDILENWYGVEIYADPDLYQENLFNARYEAQTLKSILMGICKILDCKFSIDGNKIQLYK